MNLKENNIGGCKKQQYNNNNNNDRSESGDSKIEQVSKDRGRREGRKEKDNLKRKNFEVLNDI